VLRAPCDICDYCFKLFIPKITVSKSNLSFDKRFRPLSVLDLTRERKNGVKPQRVSFILHQGPTILATVYMGHVSIASTHYYLQLSPELGQSASQRFHHYADRLFTPGGAP
jgi:hypothetical protein